MHDATRHARVHFCKSCAFAKIKCVVLRTAGWYLFYFFHFIYFYFLPLGIFGKIAKNPIFGHFFQKWPKIGVF